MNAYDNLVELRNTNYYMLVHKATNKSLYLYDKAKDFEKEQVLLSDPDQNDLSQVWMVVEVNHDRYPNMYELVHTVSTLVLTT